MEWINKNIDKVAHVFVSFFLVFLFEVFFKFILNYDQPVPLASATAFFVGMFKERFDEHKGGRIDWKDLLANAIGIVLANIYLYTLL